jgi:hypothetical protein
MLLVLDEHRIFLVAIKYKKISGNTSDEPRTRKDDHRSFNIYTYIYKRINHLIKQVALSK